MVNSVFVDSDVVLDLALLRLPHVHTSRIVLAMAQNRKFQGVTSSLCIANIYYFLSKEYGDVPARTFLTKLLNYITVLPINHAAVLESLQLNFEDFEDALQHGAAVHNKCDCIITRNTGDYRKAIISVYHPDEFLRIYYNEDVL